jgi:hypothetical protein
MPKANDDVVLREALATAETVRHAMQAAAETEHRGEHQLFLLRKERDKFLNWLANNVKRRLGRLVGGMSCQPVFKEVYFHFEEDWSRRPVAIGAITLEIRIATKCGAFKVSARGEPVAAGQISELIERVMRGAELL